MTAEAVEVVKLTPEQTGGPALGIQGGLVFEYESAPQEGREFRRVVCRISDVERALDQRAGPTPREQASLVLLGLAAGVTCLEVSNGKRS